MQSVAAEVDALTRDGQRRGHAAHPLPRLEHHDLVAGPGELPGQREPGRARADDRDHELTKATAGAPTATTLARSPRSKRGTDTSRTRTWVPSDNDTRYTVSWP